MSKENDSKMSCEKFLDTIAHDPKMESLNKAIVEAIHYIMIGKEEFDVTCKGWTISCKPYKEEEK